MIVVILAILGMFATVILFGVWLMHGGMIDIMQVTGMCKSMMAMCGNMITAHL